MTTPASAAEQVAFLKTVAYEEVKQATGHWRIAEQVDENTLLIDFSPSREPAQTVRRRPDGTYTPECLGLNQNRRSLPSYGLFERAWQDLLTRIEKELRARADRFARTAGGGHSGKSDRERITKAAFAAAYHIAAESGRIHVRANRNAIGHRILYDFIGPELVSATLSLAGQEANLGHVNQIVRHGADVVKAAYRQNPHAVIAWLRPAHAGEPAAPAAPDAIIAAGEQLLATALSRHPRGPALRDYLDTLPPSIHQDYSDRLILLLPKLRRWTGGQPVPYAIAKALLHNSVALDQGDQYPEFAAWLCHAANLPRRQRPTLAELALPLAPYNSHRIPEIAARHPGQPEQAFRELLEQCEPVKRRRRNGGRRGAPPDANAKAERQARLQRDCETLRHPDNQTHLRNLAVQRPLVVADANSACLYDSFAASRQPVISLRRKPDGRVAAEGKLASGYPLPPPGGDLDRYRAEQPYGWSVTDLPTRVRNKVAKSLPVPTATDRPGYYAGLTGAFPTEYHDEAIGRRWLQAVAGILDPSVYATAAAVAGQAPDIDCYNRVSRQGKAGAQLLATNPGAFAWAVIAPPPDHEPVNHPGQIVAHVKRQYAIAGGELWKTLAAMPADGLYQACLGSILPDNDNGRDRHLCAVMARIVDLCHLLDDKTLRPAETRVVSAVMHSRNVRADYYQMPDGVPYNGGNLGRFADADHDSLGLPGPTGLKTMALAIAGARQEGVPLVEFVQRPEVSDIADYVRWAAQEGQPVNSTTWERLRRASRRWHAQQNRRQLEADLAALRRQNGGGYRGWASAIPEKTTLPDGSEVWPARHEGDLMRIARLMNHCVSGYGGWCLRHNTRIFQIQPDGAADLAEGVTAELSLNHDGKEWATVQLRGLHNRPATEAEAAVADRLAKAYTAAWREMKPGEHDRETLFYEPDDRRKSGEFLW